MTEDRQTYTRKQGRPQGGRAGDDDDKNALEWGVFGISLLLVLGILTYLGYKAYTDEPSTPDLVVQYFPEPTANAPHRYRVVVRNQGGETAEEVQIALAVVKDGEDVESAALNIAFAPKQSKREGWVNFKEDPMQADTLMAWVVSYKRP